MALKQKKDENVRGMPPDGWLRSSTGSTAYPLNLGGVGMMQRVAIALSLASHPKLLFGR